MRLGSRITAPEGFQCFANDKVYHFLNSDSESNRVNLVQFDYSSGDLNVELMMITQFVFEEALEKGLLVEDGRDDYPPWINPSQGYSVSYRESRRTSNKETYDEKVNRRYMAIAELASRYAEILRSENPNAIINAHAKNQKPQQNAKRLRFWFFSYIVFGFNRWALTPLLNRIGGWNREEKTETKHGRPARKGRKHGYNCTADMKLKILSGYLKHRGSYKTKRELYSGILTDYFGCKIKIVNDSKVFIHPKGEPFPSFGQIKYWIKMMISPSELAVDSDGKQKARAQSGSEGSFAERLTNVCQKVEFDGYYVSEKLSGITEGSAVDGFCVVRAVCGLSGSVVGIGFAEGRETMEAYKNALFSMAVDKVKYCELFGLRIQPEEWPCNGLPPGVTFDRGPGATYDTEPEIKWLGSIEITPTFSGQSKATVESSHPRDKKRLDQPTYFQSKLNFVQMAKREILRALRDNETSDASGRAEDEIFIHEIKPTPRGIWKYFHDLGRDSSVGMPFDVAVKNFLKPHPVIIRKDAVYFYGRKYRSQALVDTRIFDKIARHGVVKSSAFSLTMCVRHIWLELEDKLYELDFVRSASTSEGSVDIPLSALMQIDQMRRTANSDLREEIPAIHQHYDDRFKTEAELGWSSGQRKSGRPSKGGAARRDTEDFDRFRGKMK